MELYIVLYILRKEETLCPRALFLVEILKDVIEKHFGDIWKRRKKVWPNKFLYFPQEYWLTNMSKLSSGKEGKSWHVRKASWRVVVLEYDLK